MLFSKETLLRKHEWLGSSDVSDHSIHVCFASDQHYIQYLGVALLSIAKNMVSQPIVFHILISEISEFNRQALQTAAQRHPHIRIQLYYLNPECFQRFYTSGHISSAAYYRLAIPTLLHEQTDTVLYVDADTLCIDNIGGLFQLNLENHIAAVVEDVIDTESHKKKLSSFGFKPENQYFNSGVMLLNLRRWQQEQLDEKLEKLLETVQDKPLTYHDQDMLNIVLQGRCLFISEQYNCLKWAKTDLQQQKIKIVHYAGEHKPWKFYANSPIYDQYYQSSPWNANPLPHYTRTTDYRLTAKVYFRRRQFGKAVSFYLQYLYRKIT